MRIPRLPWDKYWMLMAHLTATRSTCDRGPTLLFDPDRHGVGAILVKNKRAIAGGYNGSAPGQPHCNEIKCSTCGKDWSDYEIPVENPDQATLKVHALLQIGKCTCGDLLVGGHLMRDGHCVPGDTIVSKFQPGYYNTGHRSILQIYENWQDPHKRGAMRRMKIRSVTEEGFIVPDHIEDIWCVGKKPLFRFTTRLGRAVRVTPGQLILTENGWEPAVHIKEGDKIALNGVEPFDDPEWLSHQYEGLGKTQVAIATMLGCSRQTIKRRLDKFGIECREFQLGGWNRGMRREGMPRYRGVDIDDTHARERSRRYGLREECDVCGSTERLQVHHLDGKPQNDADQNLLTLCIGCHQVAHTLHAKIKKVIFDAVMVKEKSKRDERVFDLTTKKNHNYVGNGVVLHNCVRTIHSEMNALLQCALDGVSPQGAVLYSTASPCFDCAKAIIRAGIKKVYYGQEYDSRYGLSGDVAEMLLESSIETEVLVITREELNGTPDEPSS